MDRNKLLKNIYVFIIKTFLVAIITLILLIIMKTNLKFKTDFYKYVYDTNISFAKFNNLYNKYFKDFNLDLGLNKNKTDTVSNEKISYTSLKEYHDGVKLTVGSNYSVKSQESGMVVFIGNKENFKNTIIIQQINGIDLWYGNVENTNFKLYDYVKKGEIIGTSDKNLYLLYKKDGKTLNYEKYL